MTEIPEHLLKRSRERRAGDPGDADSSTPATTAAESKPATTPVATKAEVAAKVVVAKPDPTYVTAAKTRKKIPFWAMATLSMLPLWAFLYALALKPADKTEAGPIADGTKVFSQCASCHGADGSGGAGRPLYQGSVLKTFPKIEDMLNLVYTGSQAYANEGLANYGNPNREGGAHAPLSYNGAPMPAQGTAAGGGLTDAEILAVVCHERYDLSGADPVSEQYQVEYNTWCSPTSEIYSALKDGSSSFATLADDFADLETPPAVVGTTPRPSAG